MGELVSNHPETTSSSSLLDLLTFKRQQTVFIVLNLLLLAALLLMHWSLASFWGNPSPWLIATVGLVFLVRIPELLWSVGYPTRSNLWSRLRLRGLRSC